MSDVQVRILVVDDEPEILDLLKLMLKKNGYEIVTAKDGEEAYDLLKESFFDGVICDFRMPKMDGIRLLKKLRAEKMLTPFVFISGDAGNAEDLKMTSLGAFKLMTKMDIMQVPEILLKTLKEAAELKKLSADNSDATREFLNLLHSSG